MIYGWKASNGRQWRTHDVRDSVQHLTIDMRAENNEEAGDLAATRRVLEDAAIRGKCVALSTTDVLEVLDALRREVVGYRDKNFDFNGLHVTLLRVEELLTSLPIAAQRHSATAPAEQREWRAGDEAITTTDHEHVTLIRRLQDHSFQPGVLWECRLTNPVTGPDHVPFPVRDCNLSPPIAEMRKGAK